MVPQICGCYLKCVNFVSDVWIMSQVDGCCLKSNECCIFSSDTTFNCENNSSKMFYILNKLVFNWVLSPDGVSQRIWDLKSKI